MGLYRRLGTNEYSMNYLLSGQPEGLGQGAAEATGLSTYAVNMGLLTPYFHNFQSKKSRVLSV